MASVLWIDCETTGLDENKNSIIQFSGILESEGIIKDTFNIFIRPPKGSSVSLSALKINGIDIEELRNDPKYLEYPEAYKMFTDFLSKHVNKYDKMDKLILAGKNVSFDIKFLREFFIKNDDNFYGSWFFYPSIDVETIVAEYVAFSDMILPNYKLKTICEVFDIEIDAHDSFSDIQATRKLYWKLKCVEV